MNISIEYDNSMNCIVIIAIDSKFSQLRGLNVHLNLVNGKMVSPSSIEIPVANTNIINLYENIIRIFKEEYQCQISTSKYIEDLFSSAKAETEQFELFSRRALEIRNNNIDEEEFKKFSEVLANANFRRSLKTYQLLAAYHIAFSQNACNFSVPGSGKTTTVLAAYEYLRKELHAEKAVNKLVVCGPLSAFIAWKIEYRECFGYEPKTVEIRGRICRKEIEDALLKSNPDCDLVIISYGSVFKYYEVIKTFLNINRCMLVLDEAHRIKKVGDDAQSKYVLSLSPLAKSRVILTGTPAANSFVDLYNLYKFIWPNHNVIGYSIQQLAAMSKNEKDYRVDDLIKKISPFFIRVKKSDLKLPKAIFNEPICIEMSPIQQKIYNAIEEIVVNRFENNGLSESFRRAAAIRLRQAASNPELLLKPIEEDYYDMEAEDNVSSRSDEIVKDDNIIRLIRDYTKLETPNRLKYASELSKRIVDKNEKLIIWCEFTGTCDLLSVYLKKEGIDNRILYGECKQEEREFIIKEFLEVNSSFNIIVANPHAVGESISLHTTCHNALYYEMGFNAGVYMQSKDRIHRVGLKDTEITNYYFLQSKDSVDSVIYKRVLKKEEKMLNLIESQEIPLLARNMDYDENSEVDIRAIIKDYYDRREKHF